MTRRSLRSFAWAFLARRKGGAAALFFALALSAVSAKAADTSAEATPAPSDVSVAEQKADNAVVAVFLEKRIQRDPEDVTALNRLTAVYLQQLRDTGDFAFLERAAKTAQQSLAASPERNSGGLIVAARVKFESHRFAEARDLAQRLIADQPGKAGGYLLLGDALLELGEVDQALAAWQQMVKRGGDELDLQMRMARFRWLHNDLDAARTAFAKAIELANSPLAPQPNAVVWCEIQRGQLAFSLGDWQTAEQAYAAAQQLAPENYAALDHLAELRAAQKKYPESIALYQQVVARTHRPEFMQALGDVYAEAGQAPEAKTWRDRALAEYLSSAQAGNAHYYHHLAGFYCDVQPNAAEAVKWARRDLEMRQSVFAYDALAWALYQNGEIQPAEDAAQKALALNTPDAHLIYHAGMIFSRAGDFARGGELLRRVAEVNPRYFNSFHVHR